MGHADLRIRERTMPAVADRAYELLRDRAALARFVQGDLAVQHAASAERVALELEEGDHPARLVVTRDGHPVTCLGSGMAANLPVIPWPLTDAYLRLQAQALRTRIAHGRSQDEDGAEALSRVNTHPHRLTRADFDTLVVLAPLIVKTMLNTLPHVRDIYRTLMSRETWDLDKPMERDLVHAAFTAVRGTAALLLATQGEPDAVFAALRATTLQDATVARAGWWVLLAHPRRSMDSLRMAAEDVEAKVVQAAVADGLLGLATRYPWLREEAHAGLVTLMERRGKTAKDRASLLAYCDKAMAAVRARLFRLVDVLVTSQSGRGWESPGDAADMWRVYGRVFAGETDDLALAASWLGPAHEALARTWNPLERATAEPRWRAHPPDRVNAADKERADMWRLAWECHREPAARTGASAVAFSLAPPESLVPDDALRKGLTLNNHLWLFANSEVAAMRERAAKESPQGGKMQAPTGKAPVRAAEKPGPNAPCTCGSGKKYKRCCGAA